MDRRLQQLLHDYHSEPTIELQYKIAAARQRLSVPPNYYTHPPIHNLELPGISGGYCASSSPSGNAFVVGLVPPYHRDEVSKLVIYEGRHPVDELEVPGTIKDCSWSPTSNIIVAGSPAYYKE